MPDKRHRLVYYSKHGGEREGEREGGLQTYSSSSKKRPGPVLVQSHAVVKSSMCFLVGGRSVLGSPWDWHGVCTIVTLLLLGLLEVLWAIACWPFRSAAETPLVTAVDTAPNRFKGARGGDTTVPAHIIIIIIIITAVPQCWRWLGFLVVSIPGSILSS